MLTAWRDFVSKVDPDIITGFNIGFFDIPFLLGKVKQCKVGDFRVLGRPKGLL